MIVAFVPDLMDRSKLAAAASEPVRFVNLAELNELALLARLVVVDLDRPGAVEAVARMPEEVRSIGFGSHKGRETLDAARAAGCTVVLARSELFRRAGELLGPTD
jgi:hypothetical protein